MGHALVAGSEPASWRRRRTLPQHEFIEETRDLTRVNQLVAAATESWGLSDRVRRLSLPSLLYNQDDLEHMTILVAQNHECRDIAVALWEPAAGWEALPGFNTALLHGLYVVPCGQGTGVGSRLLTTVCEQMSNSGFESVVGKVWRSADRFFSRRGFAPVDRNADQQAYPRFMARYL